MHGDLFLPGTTFTLIGAMALMMSETLEKMLSTRLLTECVLGSGGGGSWGGEVEQ